MTRHHAARTRCRTLLSALGVATLSACAPVHAPPGELTPVAARVTNATAAADLATLQRWADRLAAARAAKSTAAEPTSALVAAEGDAWLAYVRERYGVARRDADVDLAFAEARRRIEALEQGPEAVRAMARAGPREAELLERVQLASAPACRVSGPTARLHELAALVDALDAVSAPRADSAVAVLTASGTHASSAPTVDTLRAPVPGALAAPPSQPASAPMPTPVSYVRTVHFAFDSDRLSAASRTVLDSVAQLAGAAHVVRLEIHGHTDPLGNARYNQALAHRRAERVAAYLRSRGLDQPVVVRAFGSSQPATNERTHAGNARNRRVEITIVTRDGTTSPSSTAERHPY